MWNLWTAVGRTQPPVLRWTVNRWLHRAGWARLLNTSSNNMNFRGTAYIETRGTRWMGRRLYWYVVRNSGLVKADLDTIRVVRCEHVHRFTYRWMLSYMRVS